MTEVGKWKRRVDSSSKQDIPPQTASPTHCRIRGYLEAHQPSWSSCLLPRVYFPGSLLQGPEQAVVMPGPWFSAGEYSSSGGTGAARPCSQDTSDKHKPRLQRRFALGKEKLSSSSITVQEMTMNKWLPATCYSVRCLPPCKPAASWPGEWKAPDSCMFAPNIAISSLHQFQLPIPAPLPALLLLSLCLRSGPKLRLTGRAQVIGTAQPGSPREGHPPSPRCPCVPISLIWYE